MATTLYAVLNPLNSSHGNFLYLTNPKTWHSNHMLRSYNGNNVDYEYFYITTLYEPGDVMVRYTDPFGQSYQNVSYMFPERQNNITIDKPLNGMTINCADGSSSKRKSYYMKFDRTPTSESQAQDIYRTSQHQIERASLWDYFEIPYIYAGDPNDWSIYIDDRQTGILHFLPIGLLGLFRFFGDFSMNIIGGPRWFDWARSSSATARTNAADAKVASNIVSTLESSASISFNKNLKTAIMSQPVGVVENTLEATYAE